MTNLITRNIFLILIFLLLFPIYYYLDTNFPLQNNYFPWDSYYYAKLANAFKYNLTLPEVSEPWGYRLLFPFILGKFSSYFDLSLNYSGIVINILSIFFAINIYMKICEENNVNRYHYFTIILIYLLVWNGQFRNALLLSVYSFGFDTFCITIYLYLIGRVLTNYNKHCELVAYFLSAILIFQRPIVIFFIPVLIFIFFIILSKFKILRQNLSTKNKIFLIKLILISSFSFILSKIIIKVSQSGYSAIHMVFTSLQFNLNISDLLYLFYTALGPIFLYFVAIFFLKNKNIFKNINFIIFKNNLSKEKAIYICYILIALFFALIGGSDSHRFLQWFIIFFLTTFTIHSQKIFKKYKLITLFFIIIALFWSRFFIPSMPPLSFSKVFEAKNHVQTNYDPNFFYGPKFLKKFRNTTEEIIIDDIIYKNIYLLDDQTLIHSVTIPKNQYCLTCKWFYWNSQVHPYKFRLSDLPIPLGYLHNQRNALVDHPKAGHRMIRFIYVLQWALIQIFIIYIFRRFNITKI
jgi:hypothetical protein